VIQVAAFALGGEETGSIGTEVRDAVVRVAEKVKTTQPSSVVGFALVMGAGLGTIMGLLVWDGPGIAIGAGIGAAIGIVVGAVWDGMRSKG
jgi:uncharacterized membrane protein